MGQSYLWVTAQCYEAEERDTRGTTNVAGNGKQILQSITDIMAEQGLKWVTDINKKCSGCQ